MELDPDKYDYGSFEVRNLGESREWSLLVREPVLEPDLPIIDCHHHFYVREDGNYMLPELSDDIGSGTNMRATVYVECGAHYWKDGPVSERPVGETEFVAQLAEGAVSAGISNSCNVCAGIVGFADLMLGDRVKPVLERHLEKANGRFRGIRNRVTWNPYGIGMKNRNFTEGMLLAPHFQEGFARLKEFGLTYDNWQYHTQLGELYALARKFPDVPIVVNHIGGVIGVGPYAEKRTEVIDQWQKGMRDLATLDNVFMKVGGLGVVVFGYKFPFRPVPPTSAELARAWRPAVDFCIQTFGPDRCMFESNFPADQQSCNYTAIWNAFKIITADLSASERLDLFHNTANRIYRLASSVPAASAA